MRKLRLALLGIVSIFCLNSCITSALIGTAVALCGENGCNNIRETKDKEFGIKIYEEKEPNRFKEYINSLNLRKRHKLEIQKGLSVNVPDGFILKKYSNYKYFYDKINNIGFPIYVDNDYDIKQVYNGKESQRYISELISISKGVSTYKIKNKKSKELSDRINEIAEIFGYDEKFLMKSPFVLSGGEKKMLGLALAVCLEPEILVLDEPTGALDYNTTVKFMKIVEKMKKNGTTVILVTHDENIVKQYSDYILKLQFKG